MSTFEIVAQTTTSFFTLQYSFLPISIILATFYYFHFKFVGSKCWKNKNIFHLKPNFLVGNIWKVNFLKSFASELNEIYFKYKNEKLIGFWMFTKPVLLVTDLNLIKNILIKDFEYFHDHGLPVDFNVDHLAGKFSLPPSLQFFHLIFFASNFFSFKDIYSTYPVRNGKI